MNNNITIKGIAVIKNKICWDEFEKRCYYRKCEFLVEDLPLARGRSAHVLEEKGLAEYILLTDSNSVFYQGIRLTSKGWNMIKRLKNRRIRENYKIQNKGEKQ